VKGSAIWGSPEKLERGFSAPDNIFDCELIAGSTNFFFTPGKDLFEDGDREKEASPMLPSPGFFLTFA
jgi:hypothetical protein